MTSTGRIGAKEVQPFLGRSPEDGLFPPALLQRSPLPRLLRDLERAYLLQLHAERGGDLGAMAEALGIKLRALYDRFRRLEIRPRHLR